MSTFRMILAILFSLLIVGGIWKYYAWNDEVAFQDPFSTIRSKLVTYTAPEKSKPSTEDFLDTVPSTPKDAMWAGDIRTDIHKDFSFGSLSAEDLTRVSSLGVVGGTPEGDILWLHYCDFDAIYCKKSYDEGIVYDYLEAYPTALSYIYKPFPSTALERDLLPHRAALCAIDKGTAKQYFSFYNSLYTVKDTSNINELIALGRWLGMDDIDDCLEQSNYDLVIQQETKLAKKLFDIKALPANIFINKRTLQRVLVPWYYELDEVLPALAAIE